MEKVGIVIVLCFSFLTADTGTLEKVVDGDTLYFYSHGQTVKCRMAYIDTPESHRNERSRKKAGRCKSVTLERMVKGGREATKHGKTLVMTGKTYRFNVIGQDRYGRSICVLRLGDITYNEKMVLDGYAVPYWKYIPRPRKRRFKVLVEEAKRKRAGL